MELYIDKENLKSLIRSRDHELYGDCIRMVKRNFDIQFTFPYEEILKDEMLSLWLIGFNEGLKGGSGTIKYDVQVPSRPLKTNVYNEFNNDANKMSAVYLLDDEKIDELANRKFMLFGRVGEEIEILSSLFFDDYQFQMMFNAQNELKNWQDIQPMLSPCTDIIIADSYILSSPDVFNNNLYALIKEICSRATNSKLNIVIFTIKDTLLNIKDIKSRIKKEVEQVTNIAPEVTIILQEKPKRTSELSLEEKKTVEHDRTIFTNYKLITSGDSFNYFNGKWETITTGRWLNICSLANRHNFKIAMDFIEKMQSNVTRLIKLNNSDAIDGKLKSNYLKKEVVE